MADVSTRYRFLIEGDARALNELEIAVQDIPDLDTRQGEVRGIGGGVHEIILFGTASLSALSALLGLITNAISAGKAVGLIKVGDIQYREPTAADLEGLKAQILAQALPASVILFLASSPVDQARLRLDVEAREIHESLLRSSGRDSFAVEQRWAVRPADLRRALLETRPRFIHFCGHGYGKAGIALEEDSGAAVNVSTEALAGLFALVADYVECVILNACYSEEQADAIAQHIPYVVGMTAAVSDKAAIHFATGFYDALGNGESVKVAFGFGSNAIALESLPEQLTPILKVRKTI